MPCTAAPTILLAEGRDRHDRKGIFMYHHNDFEAWRQHHNELLREAGERRLARELRAARSRSEPPEIRRTLLGFVAGHFPQGRKMADC
jgi:hypothetical protein